MVNINEEIEKLELKADEIQSTFVELIKQVPLKYSPHPRDTIVIGFSEYSWELLPPKLRKVKSEIIGKYRGWYNSSKKIIKKYLPEDLDSFTELYQKKERKKGDEGIIDILQFNIEVWKRDKSDVIKKFENTFSNQKNILNAIKYIEINDKTHPKKEIMHKSDGTFIQLENDIVSSIYDFVLKNPDVFHSKSPSISPHKKAAVKEKDNFICQICGDKYLENELEIDHIYPHSLGGANMIFNLMTLCIKCNKDKGNRLDYYKSIEGRKKILNNIKEFVKELPIISNFKNWLIRAGGRKKRKSNIIQKEPGSKNHIIRPKMEVIEATLKFINNPDISSEDLYDRLRPLVLQVYKYYDIEKVNEEEDKMGEKIIQAICKSMAERNDRTLLNYYIEILSILSYKEVFLEVIKTRCISILKKFYNQKNYYRNLLEILDVCGALKDVKIEILNAISQRNYELLEKFSVSRLSEYKKNGLGLIDSIQSKKQEIYDTEDKKLKEIIKDLLRNIENSNL